MDYPWIRGCRKLLRAQGGGISLYETFIASYILAVFGSGLGSIVGYRQEKDGTIFQDLIPTPENANKLSSESSASELYFHTELAFHPYLQDYLMLYGLRVDPDFCAYTTLATVDDILEGFPEKRLELLWEPLYSTGVDYSFSGKNGIRGGSKPVSILSGNSQHPDMIVDPDLMQPLTSDAGSAFRELVSRMNNVSKQILLHPGTLLIVDNRRAVHGRSIFRANWDGYDRWVKRCSVVRDLRRSAGDREFGSRIISTDSF